MDFAQHVKSSVDIVRVIGEYVRLKKQGPERWTGLCPFHSEKTPSFSVHERLQIFKCFGCGQGGDVFTFLIEHQGLTFYESLRTLAEQHGIPMPERRSKESDDEAKRREDLLRMHEMAQELFREQIRSPAGGSAREYLDQRGLGSDAAERFGIGFAAAGSRLVGLLKQRGFKDEQLIDCGLAGKSDDRPGFYDRFRERLMFPISNELGKTIAFGGRALKADQQAKYINSSETPIYDKSAVLYNLHRAKPAMRKTNRVVLVEGYMDVIGVVGAGVTEVTACCGTSLTARHVRVLRRLVDTVIVNFDADEAGQRATEKSVEQLLAEGLKVRVLELPGGLDPDEFCREHGVEAYRKLLDASPGYFTWLSDRARKRFDLKTHEGRAGAFEFLKPAVHLVPDKIQRAALANELAEHMGVDPGLLLDEFRRAAVERSRRAPEPSTGPALSQSETLLLTLFLESEQARADLLERAVLAASEDRLPAMRIFAAVQAVVETGEEFQFSAFEGRLEESDRETVSRVLFDRDRPGGVSTEEGVRAVEALEEQGLKRRHSAVRREIAEAEQTGDRERAIKLLQERIKIENKLREAGVAPSA